MQPERVGPYTIRRLLGSGGMGSVYEAWDERLRRSVAVKCIHPAKELSPARRERLLREARAAAGLSHPAVAQVHDVLSHDGRDYIVMEMVEGESLAARLATGPLPLRNGLEIARQIADGLDAAHARGIVHRDLKAENVIVDARGRVKILDFGLAKSTDPELKEESLTQEGMVMGTSRAMSPEQASGRPVDTRSDLFALGSLLYEMLTGTHPFQAATPLETMQRVVRHRPAPVRRLRPEIPQSVELLVQALLEKEPKRRPEHTGEVAAALADLADLERTVTADGASVSRLTSRARRRRALRRGAWVAAAAAVLVAAAAAAGWWWLQRRPPVVVAVLTVETVAEGQDGALELLADAVRVTMLNEVAATRGLAAVDPREVDGVEGTPAEVARAVAADEVLAATATAQGPTTRIELRRLRGADAALVKAAAFEVPTTELGLVTDAVAGQIQTVYPRYRPDPDVVRSRAASPEDLRRLLEVQQVIDDGATRDQRLWAEEELREIRASSPLLLEAYTLAATNARYLFRSTREPRHLEEARAVVAAGLRVAPRDPRILGTRCELATATGEVEEQRAAIEALAGVAPADPLVMYYRAQLAQAEGRFDDARRLYMARIRLRPSWQAYVLAGQYEMQQGRMDDAERLLRTALELDPDNVLALSVLSESLTYRDPERALPLLERLVELTDNPTEHTNLGLAYMLLGRYRDAIQPLERARELRPTGFSTVVNLADVHDLLGDRERAWPLYREVLATLANDPHPSRDQLLIKAYCLAQLGEAREAVTELDRALAQPIGTDALGEVHFQAALVLVLVGETNSALVHARKSLDAGLNPIWFVFPWFDPLREDPEFAAAVPRLAPPS